MPSLERRSARHRQWTTIDSMILVAATGIGLVCVKQVHEDAIWGWGVPGQKHVRFFAMLAQIPMLAWAVALLAIGHSRRGEPVWRLLRHPGLSACAFGLIGVAYALLMVRGQNLVRTSLGSVPAWTGRLVSEISGSYISSGYFVLVSWLAQLATGVWRPSPGWDDRLGRFLGLAWVVVMLLVSLGL